MERRSDMSFRTPERVMEALGNELEISASFGDGVVSLSALDLRGRQSSKASSQQPPTSVSA